MNETLHKRIDVTLKIIATLVALFGVWQYFADKRSEAETATKARSIDYIEAYAADTMRSAREALYGFWVVQDGFIDHVRSNKITGRDYENFVRFTLPRYKQDAELRSALFSLASFYDQIFHCRQSELCNTAILDDYFCPLAQRHQRQYGPFFQAMRDEAASTTLGRSVERYAEICPRPQ